MSAFTKTRTKWLGSPSWHASKLGFDELVANDRFDDLVLVAPAALLQDLRSGLVQLPRSS
jgi:hypothetical protein